MSYLDFTDDLENVKNNPDWLAVQFNTRHPDFKTYINFKLDIVMSTILHSVDGNKAEVIFNSYNIIDYFYSDGLFDDHPIRLEGRGKHHIINYFHNENAEVIRDMRIKWQLANSIKEELKGDF